MRAVGAMALALALASCSLFGGGAGAGRQHPAQQHRRILSIAAAAPAELRSYYSQQVDWEAVRRGRLPVRQGQGPAGLQQTRRRQHRNRGAQTAHKGNKKGSLLVNPGGPGGSGYDFVRDAGATNISEKVRANYDIVGFDPRGVKRSAPVTCLTDQERDASRAKTYALDTDAGLAEALADNKAIAAKCAEKTGPVLAHIDTVSAAKDLDILRGGGQRRRS